MTAVDGLAISREGAVVKVVNVSGERISFCLSVVREDGLPEVKMKHISVAAGEALTGIESDGEIIRAHLVGRDAGKVSSEDNVTAVISFPGVKTGIYTEKIAPDGSIMTRIEPVFGKRDIACLLYGESQGSECHLELDPKTYPGTVEKGPGMTIYPDYEKALLWRTNALIRSRFENADSVLTSLPVRREHFFLSGDATIFVLDDYKRFPTMEEEFVEILKCVRRRRSEENLQTERSKEIQVLVDDAQIHDIAPFWGNALVMMDGVPVFDQSRIWKYDPALVREVEIYRKTYTLGYRVYQGVVNFITYKGNAPAMDFNDNVRLYDFAGCSYPLEHRGESTLYWHPLLTLAPGETYSADLAALGQGPSDDIVLKIKAIGIVK